MCRPRRRHTHSPLCGSCTSPVCTLYTQCCCWNSCIRRRRTAHRSSFQRRHCRHQGRTPCTQTRCRRARRSPRRTAGTPSHSHAPTPGRTCTSICLSVQLLVPLRRWCNSRCARRPYAQRLARTAACRSCTRSARRHQNTCARRTRGTGGLAHLRASARTCPAHTAGTAGPVRRHRAACPRRQICALSAARAWRQCARVSRCKCAPHASRPRRVAPTTRCCLWRLPVGRLNSRPRTTRRARCSLDPCRSRRAQAALCLHYTRPAPATRAMCCLPQCSLPRRASAHLRAKTCGGALCAPTRTGAVLPDTRRRL